MRGMGLLILVLMLLGSALGQVKAQGVSDVCPSVDPDMGGLPPCCERVTDWRDLVAISHKLEAQMMADSAHEYLVIMDCFTGESIVAIGGPYEVNMQVGLRQSMNELMLHSHGAGTQPSVEDMTNLYMTNPLEFRLIGFDAGSNTWSRCTFKKPDWRGVWPQISQSEMLRLKAQAVELFGRLSGANYEKWNTAYLVVWTAWSAQHGILMNCERIT